MLDDLTAYLIDHLTAALIIALLCGTFLFIAWMGVLVLIEKMRYPKE